MNKKTTVSKSFRFTEEEWARIQAILAIGRKRQFYAKETDIVKELMGLTPLKALTERDVQNFRDDSIDKANKSPPHRMGVS